MERFRYPGLTPFSSAESDLFFGRDYEIEELLTKVSLDRLTILFGKSGCGKTSLVNIAFGGKNDFSDWQKYTWRALNIRSGKSLLESLIFSIGGGHNGEKENSLIAYLSEQVGNGFWLALKNAKLSFPKKNKGVILIIDEFQELFFASKQEIEIFKTELAESITETIPIRYMRKLLDNEEITNEEINELAKPVNVRVVLIMRSSEFSRLHEFSELIPNIYRNCYELLDLSVSQAEQALTKPLSAIGDFPPPHFVFTSNALAGILEMLKGEDGRISPTQLQIVGRAIEEVSISKNEVHFDESYHDIIREFMHSYYWGAIFNIQEDFREKARYLVEELLVQNKQRIVMNREVLILRYHIPMQVLEGLEHSRILQRSVDSIGRISYEIAHDFLLQPILTMQAYRILEEREKTISVLSRLKSILKSYIRKSNTK